MDCKEHGFDPHNKLSTSLSGNIIAKARVTYVFNGYGDLILTEKALIWNKSASSYLAFGIINVVTAEHAMIPIKDIYVVDTYTYIPGGGLRIINNQGKEYKFSFKHKKDFKVIYNYLKSIVGKIQK